jgi:plasmid replication initiation protein
MTLTTKPAEYVLQSHAISRARYRMSSNARKIIAMAMAQISPDFSDLEAAFPLTEFCNALGIERGGKSDKLISEAINECFECSIHLELENKSWEKFTWITHASYNAETGKISLEFSRRLADFLLELEKMYARIDLVDLGKLQSFYAFRYFELAKSYESLSGKEGNKKGQWYFTRTIPEIRQIMGIKPDEYPYTHDLRRYVVEAPIKELNSSNLGIALTLKYIREGRNLTGIRFDCKSTSQRPAVQIKNKPRYREHSCRNTPVAEPETEDEVLQRLREQYPDEYQEMLEYELAHPPTGLMTDIPHLWERSGAPIKAAHKLKLLKEQKE